MLNSKGIFCYVSLLIIVSLILCCDVFAESIVITGTQLIDKDMTYRNVSLDMTKGSFLVINNARLSIENCMISGTISPEKINLVRLVQGNLKIQNSQMRVTVSDIPAHPSELTIYKVIHVIHGQVELSHNTFTTDQSHTLGLLDTDKYVNYNFRLVNNFIYNFHGGFILNNLRNSIVEENKFSKVSISNVLVLNSDKVNIVKNDILFSGNNNVGDAVDILNSENIKLEHNFIASGSCYLVLIVRGKNILVSHNVIVGGITYGVFITDSLVSDGKDWLYEMIQNTGYVPQGNNQNITIQNNYFSQNRYGLAARNVLGLEVHDNIFIQKFTNELRRKFWTNTDFHLKYIKDLQWKNNYYKEAYSQQELNNNDPKSSKLVSYPAGGGVIL